MDIDLLFTADGEAGLVSDHSFDNPVAGVMFDVQAQIFSLEFTDMESLELNIPVDSDYVQNLVYEDSIQVAALEDSRIEQSWQVPLLLINDPADDQNNAAGHRLPSKPASSPLAFERFLRACAAGQPVHRDDLGDEASAGAVMGGMNTAVLQFAPHLARQRALEAQPKLGPAPSAPGMGMGGGGGGGGPVNSGSGDRTGPAAQKPRVPREDED